MDFDGDSASVTKTLVESDLETASTITVYDGADSSYHGYRTAGQPPAFAVSHTTLDLNNAVGRARFRTHSVDIVTALVLQVEKPGTGRNDGDSLNDAEDIQASAELASIFHSLIDNI